MNGEIFAFSIIILLFSVIIHEVMHGLAALYYGDPTAQRAGRLTLNPLSHIDPFGTIILPGLLLLSGSPILFGWAKPVPVNPFNFRDIRKGELATSSAGILANIILAVVASLIIHLLGNSLNLTSFSILQFAVDINLILAVFNLLPIPPLDGSKIVLSFLPPKLAAQYQALEKYGIFILLFLWLIPFGRTTILGAVVSLLLSFFHYLLGV